MKKVGVILLLTENKMLNGGIINGFDVNYAVITPNTVEKDIVTSFSTSMKTKYAFKSDLGQIFNFNTSAHSCSGKNQKYGNIMLNANPNNIPDIEIIEYQSPLKNGGILQNRRFERQEISFDLEIISNNIQNLEKEIQMMKRVFNSPGKLYKKYDKVTCCLEAYLKDFQVGEMKLGGTKVDITFESLSPFWLNENIGHKYFENQTTKLDGTILVNDSDDDVNYSVSIQVLQITGAVNSFKLNINGYEIEVNNSIQVDDIITFDSKKSTVSINSDEVMYLGEFIEIPIGKPVPVKLEWGTGNIDKYNFYMLYDKIIL